MKSFRLGEWAVHPLAGNASNGEASVRFEPKVMAVLVYLAERAGRVIPKEEILDAIWGDVQVTEVVLARGVSEVRRLLGDDARAPRFIETLPKRGYRLIAEVEILGDVVQPRPAVVPVTRPHRSSVYPWLLMLAALVAFGLIAFWWWWPPAPHPSSVAVRSFRNLASDSGSDYFSSGVTEDIITALFKVRELKVIPPQAPGVAPIERELAASILEGSVRREGRRVRIVAQLTQAATGEILWRENYDRDVADIFDIQRDVAGRIAAALKAELSPRERRHLDRRPTEEMAAYDFYLQGREHYRRYQHDANEAAIELFQQAIALDPDFALAYAGLANAYGLRMANYGISQDQTELAISAAERARTLEPELAEAHKALGLAYSQQGWSRLALQAYDRALDLRPDYDEAIHNSTFLRQKLGEWDEAARWQRRLESLPVKLK